MKVNQKFISRIRIKTASNSGFIMSIGCQEFIIPDNDEGIKNAMNDLAAYLMDPIKAEKEFNEALRTSEREFDNQRDEGYGIGVGTVAPPEEMPITSPAQVQLKSNSS
jgi:hypothetical protein